MPIHDWSRVDAGIFHDFHQSWIIEIRNILNAELLPDEFYALAEQVTHSIDQERYAEKATRVAIHHVSGDEVVGFLKIVSLGNKHSEVAITRFCDKIAEAIRHGIHVMVIDLHGPTARDPRGVPARFWEDHFGDDTAPGVTTTDPLGLSAYRSDLSPTAYFEPTAVGRTLIDMPAFWTPDLDVNVPLELSYEAAWKAVPKQWKEVIAA